MSAIRILLAIGLLLLSFSAIAAEESTGAEIAIAIGTFVLACVTTGLWIATHRLHKGAERASAKTATQMTEQIEAAVASNNALRAVADATKNNAVLFSELMTKQARAYIVADFGRGYYQDKNYYFGGECFVRNDGLTPAYNVSFWCCAKVMKNEAVDLSRPAGIPINANDATVAPRQQFVIRNSLDFKFSDDEVALILEGQKQKLFLFGELSYDDIYGKPHVTKFCHTFFFTKAYDKDGKDVGYNANPLLHPSHNSAT